MAVIGVPLTGDDTRHRRQVDNPSGISQCRRDRRAIQDVPVPIATGFEQIQPYVLGTGSTKPRDECSPN
jgi:hypothetical protein